MKYAIFGPGRVGTNIAAYLAHLGHEATLITRQQSKYDKAHCMRIIADADIIAAALPDSAIGPWHAEWSRDIGSKLMIHFSGSISVEGMHAFHPLYSFPPHVLEPDTLKSIAFACPDDGPAFAEVFAGAPNPHFEISDKDRAHYHALAVLSGNFAAFLWNETAKTFEDRHNVPAESILAGYFSGVVDRFRESPRSSLTGPIARRDRASAEANLAALKGDEKLEELYRAFLRAAWPDYDQHKDGNQQ